MRKMPGASGGGISYDRTYHFDGYNWCNYTSTNGGAGAGWGHAHMDNADGQGGWWDEWISDLMTIRCGVWELT